MSNDTALFLHLLWEDVDTQEHLFSAFFAQVQQGASRLQIEQWLRQAVSMIPEQRRLLFACGVNPDAVLWEQLVEFLCACFYAKRRRSAYPEVPFPDEWKEATSNGHFLVPHPQRERAIQETVPLPMVPLEERLLSLGGRRVVYVGEPDLHPLLRRGEVFEGNAVLKLGEPSQCHTNAVRNWKEAPLVYAVVTGYALSEDGLWRQHSWNIRIHPTRRRCLLVETTVRRVKYFGFVLTNQEAQQRAAEASL